MTVGGQNVKAKHKVLVWFGYTAASAVVYFCLFLAFHNIVAILGGVL